MIFILDWKNKDLESRQGMDEMTGDALKYFQSLVASAFNDAFTIVKMSY